MKNKRKFFTLISLLVVSLSSCGSKTNESEDVRQEASVAQTEQMKKYNIVLTLDNYRTYIDQRYIATESYTSYYFQGSLSYAFYDNVVIRANNPNSGGGDYDIHLSAGGYGRFWSSSRYTTEHKVIGITGNVIYWI